MGRIKKRAKSSIISSFFLTFTFLIFGTLELYMSNREEFWFSYRDMLSTIVAVSALVIGVCVIILMLLPNRFFKYGIALINGFTCALYFQGNFLPNDYGVLDGTAIEWGNYQWRFIYNSIMWCFLILAAILFVKKNEKVFYSISEVVIGIILATQIVTLVTVGLMLPKNDNESILSVDGQFEISKKNNIIVFVLDCFDSELFCELLQEYPSDVEKVFEDFTFYHNTVGGATRTKYAIPYMFTGLTNTEGDSYKEYLEKSFNASPLIEELQTGKYDARLYTGSSYVDMQQTKAIDNIASNALYPISKLGLTQNFLKLVAFRYMPHAMKKYFWVYSGDFDIWKENNVAYILNDSAFYEKLNTEGLQSSIDEDVFRFYHLTGVHEPYLMNENCERIDLGEGSEHGQALGSLRIVSEFIEQLKNLDLYEDSAIFIVADHGSRNYDQNPLFMVKLKGIRHQFQQSEMPLSYKDFPKMLTAMLQGKKIDFENEYACLGERYFYVGREENNKISIVEYISEEAAYDAESFYPTGQVFLTNRKQNSYKYKIGQKLSFAEDATANLYCKSGFYQNEAVHTWVGKDKCAEMYFELEGKYDNLLLQLEYGTYAQMQEVKIYANGNIIADYRARGREQKQIIIPQKYIENDVLELKFEFPNAISPADMKESRDRRELALRMYSMELESTDREFDLGDQVMQCYELGTTLIFSNKCDNTEKYCVNGFSGAEDNWTWTNSNMANMNFLILNEQPEDLVLEYTCVPFNGKQHVILYANDQKIADYNLTAEEIKDIFIPSRYIDGGKLNLRFELPDAIAPKDLNIGDDTRKLGVAIKNLEINVLNFDEYDRIMGNYELGKVLTFSNTADTAKDYCINGFSNAEETGTWTNSDVANMSFVILNKELGDMVLEYTCVPFNGKQHVILYANEQKIMDYNQTGEETKKITLPAECIQDGKLNLRFELPEAKSPKEVGMSDDARMLGLFMKELIIEELMMKEEESGAGDQVMERYELGKVLTFSDINNNAGGYCKGGFAVPEDEWTWTESNAVNMGFFIPDKKLKDMVLEYTCAPFNGKQHVILYANDQKIADYDQTGEETKKLTLPAECIQDGKLNLRFELPDAVAPKELGMSEDSRTLGLAMKELVINAVDKRLVISTAE